MKGVFTLKKSAVIAAVCMAALCVSGCGKSSPEKEQKKVLKDVEGTVGKFLQKGSYVKVYDEDSSCVYVSAAQVQGIEVGENSVKVSTIGGSQTFSFNDSRISLDKDCNVIIRPKNEVRKQTKERTELLSSAVEGKDVERAKLCISLGADVNANGRYGKPALMQAADSYNYDNKGIVELLVKSGANVDATDKDGDTALIKAAKRGNKDVAEVLLKSGANVNAANFDGGTPLYFAVVNGNKEVAEMLVREGADSGVALLRATKERAAGAVKSLIETGANVNVKDSEGVSVLTYALLYGRNDIAEALRAAGATE